MSKQTAYGSKNEKKASDLYNCTTKLLLKIMLILSCQRVGWSLIQDGLMLELLQMGLLLLVATVVAKVYLR